MALANLDFAELNDKVKEAVGAELPLVDELRAEVRKLNVSKLGERPCKAIAPVATDGGENRLSFEPVNLEIIRVVDSNGTDLVQEVIPLSLEHAVFASYAGRIAVLQKLLQALGNLRFGDLSFYVGSRGRADDERHPDLRAQVRAFRDIVEWAVILDLASRDWPTDVLLLRDGLLRTKVFRLGTFPLLDRAFQRCFTEQSQPGKHRVYLVGVAKTSAVLSKLGLALSLEGTFDKDYSCYVEMPRELEAKCYNFDRTWLDTAEDQEPGEASRYQSFGRLHLVKLSGMRTAPVFPVDLPVWLPAKERRMVLEYVAYDARDNFPVIGYPHSLQKAHEYAVMNGLEMTVIADMMIGHLLAGMPPEATEKILRLVNLGRGLVRGGARHGG